MKHFLLPSLPGPNGEVELVGSDYHYLIRVRRLEPGGVVDALAPDGRLGRLLIQKVLPNRAWGQWSPFSHAELLEPDIHLFPALLKGRKLDDALRAAVEMGIRGWHAWLAHHSVSRELSQGTLQRWERIARSAAMQSGRSGLTTLHYETDIRSVLSQHTFPTLIVFHHVPTEFQSLHRILDETKGPWALVFGPEGGLDSSEVEFFRSKGARFAWLGHGILRSETAILYGLAAVHTILREKDSWKIP